MFAEFELREAIGLSQRVAYMAGRLDQREIEILTDAIEIIEGRRILMEADYHFIGPGATARFNAYETLTGALIHLRKRRSGLEWNALAES